MFAQTYGYCNKGNNGRNLEYTFQKLPQEYNQTYSFKETPLVVFGSETRGGSLNVGVWAKIFRAPAARDLYRFTKKNIARRRRAKIFGSKNVQNVIFNRFPMINDVKSTKIFRCAAISSQSPYLKMTRNKGGEMAKGGKMARNSTDMNP